MGHHGATTAHREEVTMSSGIDRPLLTSDDAARRRVINRLRRLEGQVRALQRMIDEGRSCREVLTLLAGVRSALNATGDVILEHYARACATEIERGETNVMDLVEAVKLTRG
jgi:CsoR family transcriptional regulator, copper-sensing transcriptional repressor